VRNECEVNELKENRPPFVEVAPKEVCKNMDHMQCFLQDIIDGGGEGIILRDPLAPYQSGRSLGFLKHKVSFFFFLSVSITDIFV
jgi:DNA ligase-1